MLSAGTVLRRRGDVRYRRVDSEAVVLVQDSAEVVGLNRVGAAILEAVDGTRTVAEVRDILCERFEAPPERLEADALAFLGQLVEMGVLEEAL